MASKKNVAQKKKDNTNNKKKINNKTKNESRETRATINKHVYSVLLIVILVFFILSLSVYYINKYLIIRDKRLNLGVVYQSNDSEVFKDIIYSLMKQNRPKYNISIFYNIKDAQELYNKNEIDIYLYNKNDSIVLNKSNKLIYDNIDLIIQNKKFMNPKIFNSTQKSFDRITHPILTSKKYIDLNVNLEETEEEKLIDISKLNEIRIVNIFSLILLPLFLLIIYIPLLHENIIEKRNDKKEKLNKMINNNNNKDKDKDKDKDIVDKDSIKKEENIEIKEVKKEKIDKKENKKINSKDKDLKKENKKKSNTNNKEENKKKEIKNKVIKKGK